MSLLPCQFVLLLTCLFVLGGCQSGTIGEAIDAPLLLNSEAASLRDRAEPFDGVVAFVRSLKRNKDGSYQAIEGEDVRVSFYFSVMTRHGAFVREGGIGLKDDDPTNFFGTRIPDDKAWDAVNTDGKKIGQLYKDGDFGADVWGGHARRNWSHVEGHETSKAIGPNELICCWSFVSELTLPFSEIEPTGEWGTVNIPMWVSVYYYDIAEQRYEKAHRMFDLAIQFQPKPSGDD